MPAKRATNPTRPATAKRPATTGPRLAPKRAVGASRTQRDPPTATARAHETAKAPVKKAKSSYKPRTAGPTSTESERLLALHARLDAFIRKSFPKVEAVFDYGMHGWRMPRLRKVEWTSGTVDPNYVVVGVAERAQGITLHVWNPIEWGMLKASEAELKASGFKVMVGCLQFTRKSDYPVEAVEALLGRVAAQVRAEA